MKVPTTTLDRKRDEDLERFNTPRAWLQLLGPAIVEELVTEARRDADRMRKGERIK